ncbi:cation diffusion facilitator family transporter [Spirochaeta cellobiosiphila]|uniref:cation diffusion facilitator family transporter n=1 Tax=Spirochaeta cellobiosiphila TaxID=504483 RepID=UPI00040B44CE|nr:cation diffusion facilitator family transporter [Spirochaeta cellobiosiphila]
MDSKERLHLINRASWAGIMGNALLSGTKLVLGFLSGSLAVIGDGVDSATDILTSIITLVSARIAAKPPDAQHPYGHGRAETIATKVLSFVIVFAGFQLAVTTIKQLIIKQSMAIPTSLALIATGISVIGKILLALYKGRIGRLTQSNMLIADAKNMRNDILISFSVLIGLFFTFILGLPILDKILALFLSVIIVKVGFEIFIETSEELMDGISDPEIYKIVFDAVKKIQGVNNPHKTRIRKVNNLYVVEMDIEVDPQLSVAEGHQLASEVEKSIRHSVENIYDVLIHVEPEGIHHSREEFGLKESDLNPQ